MDNSFFNHNIRELYKKLSLLNGFDDAQINRQLLDPDVRLLLDMMQQFTDLLSQQLTHQENVVSEKLIQILAETLFLPSPAVAVFDVGAFQCKPSYYSARRGEYITIVSDQRREQVKCLLDVEKSLSLNGIKLVEHKNELSLTLRCIESMSYQDLLNKLCRYNLPFIMMGEDYYVCQCLKYLANDNLEEILMIVSIDNDSGLSKTISSQKMNIEIGLDLSLVSNCGEFDVSPHILYNYFCYKEIFSGFSLSLGRVGLQAKRQGLVSEITLLFRFKEKVSEFTNVGLCLNPLIVAKLFRTQILPSKLSNLDEFPLYLAKGLNGNEQIFQLGELDIFKTEQSTDKKGISDNLERESNLIERMKQHLFRRYDNSQTKYTVSTDYSHFTNETVLLVGEVELSDSNANFLPDIDIVHSDNEVVEHLTCAKLLFQKCGDGWKVPIRAKSSMLIELTKIAQLMRRPKSYINNLLNLSNPEYLQMRVAEKDGLACTEANIEKKKKLLGRKAYHGYLLKVVLNKNVAELPSIVLIAIGLCKQIFTVWDICLGLTIGVYDIDHQLLITKTNVQ